MTETTAPAAPKKPARPQLAKELAGALASAKIQSDEIKDVGCRLGTGIPNIDHALSGQYRGGGFKSARINEVAGDPSTGKTLISQHVIREAQLMGGAGAFHDHEGTFVPKLFERFGGSIEPGLFTYKKPRTLEESFDQAIDWMRTIRDSDVIAFEAPLVCVFDSVAAMVPGELIERDMSQARNMRDRMSLPMTLSQELGAFNHFVTDNNICAIFLNQLREKPGTPKGQDPRYTPGGKSLDFYNAITVYLGRSLKKDKDNKTIGQTVRFETKKNKTHRAHIKDSFEFRWNEDGTGYIDVIDSMLGHLIKNEKIEMAGAYMVWEGKKVYRSVLAERMNATNPEEIIERLIDIAEGV